jgi:hypothetical protein
MNATHFLHGTPQTEEPSTWVAGVLISVRLSVFKAQVVVHHKLDQKFIFFCAKDARFKIST